MSTAYKLFNFILPFETYEKLKRISKANEVSIAYLVRQGVEIVLNNKENKCAGDTEK